MYIDLSCASSLFDVCRVGLLLALCQTYYSITCMSIHISICMYIYPYTSMYIHMYVCIYLFQYIYTVRIYMYLYASRALTVCAVSFVYNFPLFVS